jgi:uncharacterized tellurite resistance protein B-like protein
MPPIAARTALAPLGAPTGDHLDIATQWMAELPDAVAEAVREPAGAASLVHLLLLSRNPADRARQLDLLRSNLNPALFGELARLEPAASTLDASHRLTVVELALPALRQMSPAQYARFLSTTTSLIESDGQIDLFEYALQKMMVRHLDPQFRPARRRPHQYYALRPLREDCAVLLSLLAHVGHEDEAAIAKAFQRGAAGLQGADDSMRLLPPAQCNLAGLDTALERLGQAVPPIKKAVLQACAETVAADGMMDPREAELLRAIADSLDCPLPPWAT